MNDEKSEDFLSSTSNRRDKFFEKFKSNVKYSLFDKLNSQFPEFKLYKKQLYITNF